MEITNNTQVQTEQTPRNISPKKRMPTWREMNMDTTPEAEAVLFELWRNTPTWRKFELLEDLNRTARQLALTGLRHRHPNASPAELKRRLATILLGDELATKAFGPLSDSYSQTK